MTNGVKKTTCAGTASGFTLMEVMISLVLLTVGMLGLISAVNTVVRYQNRAKDVTLATMIASNKLEEIKRYGTNEPTGGAHGFEYLVGDYPTDEVMTSADNWTYTKTETVDGFTRTLTLMVYPHGGSDSFLIPGEVKMLEVVVKAAWTDEGLINREVELAGLLHRRQFLE